MSPLRITVGKERETLPFDATRKWKLKGADLVVSTGNQADEDHWIREMDGDTVLQEVFVAKDKPVTFYVADSVKISAKVVEVKP